MNLGIFHPRTFFLETWREMDREAAAERAAHGDAYDFRPLVAMIVSAVCLTLAVYWGDARTLTRVIAEIDPAPGDFLFNLRHGPWWELAIRGYWASWRVLGYFIIPALMAKAYGETLREQGIARSEHAYGHVYLASYLVVFGCVLVIYATGDEDFFNTYPFYQAASRSWVDFLSWEAFYIAQFFALEFFFRGLWLRALKRTMGSHAIFVMMVPYVMIHHPGKPLPETLGAIFAGIFLGTLAMKTKSIWGGFFVHVGVAVSMDFMALLHGDRLPETWLPVF